MMLMLKGVLKWTILLSLVFALVGCAPARDNKDLEEGESLEQVESQKAAATLAGIGNVRVQSESNYMVMSWTTAGTNINNFVLKTCDLKLSKCWVYLNLTCKASRCDAYTKDNPTTPLPPNDVSVIVSARSGGGNEYFLTDYRWSNLGGLALQVVLPATSTTTQ